MDNFNESSCLSDARGYYEMDKLCGRTKLGIYYHHPDPREERFTKWPFPYSRRTKTTINYDTLKGREQKHIKKND